MNLYTRRAWTLLPACLLLLVLAAGCVNDESTCKEASDVEDVKLRFTVVTRASADSAPRTAANAGMNADTRAADIDGDLEGSPAENYLDLAGRDIRFLLFDTDQKYLCDFTPDVDITADDANRYITYTVRATLTESYFTDKAALGQAIDFYIMVLANGRAYDLTALALGRGMTTIAEVMNQFAFFTPATTTTHADGSSQGWEPSAPGTPGGTYIPMAGLQHFTIAAGAFTGGKEGFVDLSGTGGKDINMLRALAKIEVIDRIDVEGDFDPLDADRVSIAGADLLGYCATGTILPAYGQWGNNNVLVNGTIVPETQQVTAPTLPQTIAYRNPAAPTVGIGNPTTGTLIAFHKDDAAQDARTDKCPVYAAYVPEYSLTNIRAALGNTVPMYARVLIDNPQLTENARQQHYLLELANYTDSKPVEDLPQLRRNHIYRYAINGVRQEAGVIVNYTVCPWSTPVIDIPTFD